MNQTETDSELYRLVYLQSTHAPLFERYWQGEYHDVGEAGEYGPVDPETGAEYRALGGAKHRYNKDYRTGSSYPETVFVYGATGTADTVTHDELESALREHDLWTDAYTEVIIPNGMKYGEPTWWNAFQIRPPERAPLMSRLTRKLENKFDNTDDGEREVGDSSVLAFERNIEVYLPR